MKLYLPALLASFIFVGCASIEPISAVTPTAAHHVDGTPDVYDVSSNDPQMNAAIEKAQATLDQFLAALALPKPSQTYFSVKARFPYPNGSGGTSYEHIWLESVTYTDGQFSGLIGNEPVEVTNLHLGEKVTVPKADIADWFIIDNNHMLGGYTVRVLRGRMTDDERQKFDQEWGASSISKIQPALVRF